MIKVNPIRLRGNWTAGFALDVHTIKSIPVGYDEYGHRVFDTQRSPIGELLYRLKYQADQSALPAIVEVASHFLKTRLSWNIDGSLNGIVPVPPSTPRNFQPVIAIAKGIGAQMNIQLYQNALKKIKATPALKNVFDYQKRLEVLNNVFAVNEQLQQKNVVLFDDLYRSGATLQVITRVLYEQGKVNNVYVLTLTKTRSKT
jgi:predicted amidophosphoribosyltransferase